MSPPAVRKTFLQAAGTPLRTQGAGTRLLLTRFHRLRSVAFPEGEGVQREVAGVSSDVADAVGEVFGIADEGVAVSFLPDGALPVAMGEGAFPCLDKFFHGH